MFMVFLPAIERIYLIHLRPCGKLGQSTLLHDNQKFMHEGKWTGAMFGFSWRLRARVRLARPQNRPVKPNRQWVAACEPSNQQSAKPCFNAPRTALS